MHKAEEWQKASKELDCDLERECQDNITGGNDNQETYSMHTTQHTTHTPTHNTLKNCTKGQFIVIGGKEEEEASEEVGLQVWDHLS